MTIETGGDGSSEEMEEMGCRKEKKETRAKLLDDVRGAKTL